MPSGRASNLANARYGSVSSRSVAVVAATRRAGSEPCAVVDTVMVVTADDETTTLEITPVERAALLGDREEAG